MATWIGVITNAGNGLLNEWVNEKTLNFDYAAAGQGSVAVVAMMAQTALVSRKQTASLLGSEKVLNGIRLRLRIAAPATPYMLNQFGVWASVDGGTPAMLALFQLEPGIPIPSKTESPDFVYTFYALISCSNTGAWTVTVDSSACVTQDDMAAAISEAVKTKQDKITVKGLLLGDGNGNISAAVAGKDYGYPLATGSGAPTSATAGTAGQHYYDSSTGKEYVCNGKDSSGKYQWKLSGASDAADLTFEGRNLNEVLGAIEEKKADLGDDGKVPEEQLPEMDYDPAGSAAAVQNLLAGHTANLDNPHQVQASQIPCLPWDNVLDAVSDINNQLNKTAETQYKWAKSQYQLSQAGTSTRFVTVNAGKLPYSHTIYYANEVTVTADHKVMLVNPTALTYTGQQIEDSRATYISLLAGKYVSHSSAATASVFYIGPNPSIVCTYNSSDKTYTQYFTPAYTVSVVRQSLGYVYSEIRHTYPDAGEQDGYYYEYAGETNTAVIPRIVTGSYTGDGTSTRSIILPFTPKLVIVLSNNTSSIKLSSFGMGFGTYNTYGQIGGKGKGISEGGFSVGTADGSITGTSGFISTNTNNILYNYVAIG